MSKQTTVTPGKLALIGVLAVVLIGVVYIQFKDTPAKSPTSTAQPAAHNSTRNNRIKPKANFRAGTKGSGAIRKKAEALGNWQSRGLAAVIKFDPFALPALFPQPRANGDAVALAQGAANTKQDESAQKSALAAERAALQAILESLRKQGAKVIIQGEKEYVALIGDQILHVGDQIDGFTVIGIDADGVQLAKDLSP